MPKLIDKQDLLSKPEPADLKNPVTGCASQAIMRGDIVTVKERMFGLIVSESPANQTPQVKLGFNSVVVQFIPTIRERPARSSAGKIAQTDMDLAQVTIGTILASLGV